MFDHFLVKAYKMNYSQIWPTEIIQTAAASWTNLCVSKWNIFDEETFLQQQQHQREKKLSNNNNNTP